MKDQKRIVFFAVVALLAGSAMFGGCEKHRPPIIRMDQHDTRWDDSTGIAISDTLVVMFGDERWTTLTYDSYLDESDSLAVYRWVDVSAHAPGKAFPRVKMRILLDEGNHTSHMTVNNPGLGFTVPGRLVGDMLCGNVYYFEDKEIRSPDGTITSDWWPWTITMSVLEYKQEEELLTGRVIATMFDYESWINREVQYVDSAEMRPLIISFGNMPVRHH